MPKLLKNDYFSKLAKILFEDVFQPKNTLQIQESEKFLKVKNKIRKYQKFIENNFEYVGKNFAHEARLIHYNDKKKSKGIYGDATIEEVKELKEEGIETEALFFVNKKDNQFFLKIAIQFTDLSELTLH